MGPQAQCKVKMNHVEEPQHSLGLGSGLGRVGFIKYAFNFSNLVQILGWLVCHMIHVLRI